MGVNGKAALVNGSAVAKRLERVLEGVEVIPEPDVGVPGVTPSVEVRPVDEEQLRAALRFCDDNGLGTCVAGGRTKLQWGNRPNRCDVLISTIRLDGCSAIDGDDLTFTTRSGKRVSEARAEARAMSRVLPLDPGRPAAATMGGVVATGEEGVRNAGYGGVRDVVLGVRAVLADGTRVGFGGRTRKNVAGYDLTKLFIGSHGALGIISEITLRLLPSPDAQVLMVMCMQSLEDAELEAAHILDAPAQPLALEVLSSCLARPVSEALSSMRAEVDPVPPRPLLLAGFAGHRAENVRFLRDACNGPNSISPVILEDSQAESIYEVLAEECAPAVGEDWPLTARAIVPVAEVWPLARAAVSAASTSKLSLGYRIGAARGVLDLVLGGGGDTGLIEPRLSACVADIRRHAVRLGGWLAVTSGLSLLSPGFDAWGDPGGWLPMMKRMKERFDPHQTLNPGRFWGGI